jgi:hypothetical protein
LAVAHTLSIGLTGEPAGLADLTPLGILFKEFHATAGDRFAAEERQGPIEKMRKDLLHQLRLLRATAATIVSAAAIPLKAAG